MKARQLLLIPLYAVLFALPLAALDVSPVKQGAPVKHGRKWEQRSEFEASVKDGARLLLRADNGGVSVNPTSSGKVTCIVILRAYTSNEAEARGLFEKFKLSDRSVEAGGGFLFHTFTRARAAGG